MTEDEVIAAMQNLGYTVDSSCYIHQIEVAGAAPSVCPLCGKPLAEDAHLDSGDSCWEIVIGCHHHNVWWFVGNEKME